MFLWVVVGSSLLLREKLSEGRVEDADNLRALVVDDRMSCHVLAAARRRGSTRRTVPARGRYRARRGAILFDGLLCWDDLGGVNGRIGERRALRMCGSRPEWKSTTNEGIPEGVGQLRDPVIWG